MLSRPMRRIHFDVTDSTNTQARLLAANHPGERLLVTAAEQTAGRGRQGRRWLSPRGGAWMTIVWPMRKSPDAYRGASLAAAIGVRRALIKLLQRGLPAEVASLVTRPLIKWPNDLLIEDAKVVGILCEQVRLGDSAEHVLLIGIGVNVAFEQALLDEPGDGQRLRHCATTLSNVAGRPFETDDVIRHVSAAVGQSMEEFEAAGLASAYAKGRPSLVDELRDALAYVGADRKWLTPRGETNGRILGIDDEGRLLLEADGQILACDVGEISGEES